MAVGWFICVYENKAQRQYMQSCAMNRFTADIELDGGTWKESEVLGSSAVVKVRASDVTLAKIASTQGFQRIMAAFLRLSDSLGSLTTAQRTAIRDRILAMGYPLDEINTWLGSTLNDWRNLTLGDLLRFITRRRLLPRWDAGQGKIVLDGPAVACTPIEEIDNGVTP